MKREERQAWAAKVLEDLLPMLGPDDEIVFFAGDKYREYLTGPLTKAGIKYTIPMEGLGIGSQLGWFDNAWREMTGQEVKILNGGGAPKDPGNPNEPRAPKTVKTFKSLDAEFNSLIKERDKTREKVIAKNLEYETELESLNEQLSLLDIKMKGTEDLKEIIKHEFESLECHISAHPLDDPLIKLMMRKATSIKELDELFLEGIRDNDQVTFACTYKSGKETIAKRSQKPMFTMMFEGRAKSIVARKFGHHIPEYRQRLVEGQIYIISGKWSNKYGVDIVSALTLNNFFRNKFIPKAEAAGIDIAEMLYGYSIPD
jgi:hypothetical protein